MGSPNFYTGAELKINFAIEAACDCEECCICGLASDVHDQYKAAEDFVSNLETLFFHKVEANTGYNTGFQIYLWQEATVDSIVNDWNKYKEFFDVDGYTQDLESCDYFRKGVKNATPFNVQYAINKELAYLSELLAEFARENGLGKLVGRTWTSSVSYEWLNPEAKAA